MQNPSRSRSVIACPSHGQGGPAEPVTTVAGSAAGVSVALLRQGQHCEREPAVMEGQRAEPERPHVVDTATPDPSSSATIGKLATSKVACWSAAKFSAREPHRCSPCSSPRTPRRPRPGTSPGLSCGLIHSCPRSFTDGHPARVHARRERWRTSVNAGQHCWEACWVQALASSNLASSATLICDDALGWCSRAALHPKRVSHFLSQFEPWPYFLFRAKRRGWHAEMTHVVPGQGRRGRTRKDGARRSSVRPSVRCRPGSSATRVQVAVSCDWIPGNSQTASH
jgi:hypothetical protein